MFLILGRYIPGVDPGEQGASPQGQFCFYIGLYYRVGHKLHCVSKIEYETCSRCQIPCSFIPTFKTRKGLSTFGTKRRVLQAALPLVCIYRSFVSYCTDTPCSLEYKCSCVLLLRVTSAQPQASSMLFLSLTWHAVPTTPLYPHVHTPSMSLVGKVRKRTATIIKTNTYQVCAVCPGVCWTPRLYYRLCSARHRFPGW